MRHYSHYGLNDFVICLGYKGYMIKKYFANYVFRNVRAMSALPPKDGVIGRRLVDS